ncbi:HAD-IA family hydrolase [Arthrobacter silvisoli]|uniref:HAD-IA family hydrolase n=1 Tax=Arthrobacter silvisoli TaxID=2291022 RepID=UPI000E215743|nr:HAD-IA family hydrolase [Arthrobacter silvisoli]
MPGSPTAAAARPRFDAVIFDLDGVVTNTSVVHEAAWKDTFDRVLADERVPGSADTSPFKEEDYLDYVDGRPRTAGVSAFLAARGIELPPGDERDPSGAWTICGIAALKNELFMMRLQRDGVQAFAGTVEFLRRMRASRVAVALATSSRNAPAVLAAAGLSAEFDAIVDGSAAADLHLAGKPAPDLFLEVARWLGVSPVRTVIVEDAVSGIQAGRRGGFGLVVGIDRVGRRTELEAAGADIVLKDVSELDLGLIETDPWMLVYEGQDRAHEGHREALTTLGNGYMGVRGAAVECPAGWRGYGNGYPGMYLAGVFNRVPAVIEGRKFQEEHMVNAPNCLPVDFRLRGKRWWSDGGFTVRKERRTLDLRRAVLRREVLLEADGKLLEVDEVRFVSADSPHLMAMQFTLTARGWNGELLCRGGIDAGVANANTAEPAPGGRYHLRDLTEPEQGSVLVVEAETLQSKVRIAAACTMRVEGQEVRLKHGRIGAFHYRTFRIVLAAGESVRIAKTVAVATSRDRAIASPRTAVLDLLGSPAIGFAGLLAAHEAAWGRALAPFRIRTDASAQVRLVLNLHIFHLLQTLTRHTAELDAGVPARGLHGEGYRGHVFWDELFVLPLLTSRVPDVARGLLDYRWRRLPAARRAAAERGLMGAMFPWQSGSDGREETPDWLYSISSGHWIPDYSHLQRHVGLAVAFNAWQYYEATQDADWLLTKGADLIIEVARFFASKAEHDQAQDRFHLRGVVGPDEYHTGSPDDPSSGLDDNAYTNIMTAWVCDRAARMVSVIGKHDAEELSRRLQLTDAELGRWEHIARRIFVPFHADGVISQFEGYERLKELDWQRYRQRYGNIERLDLILEAEGDGANSYRLAKQADVLMLPYLLGQEDLLSILERLGYTVSQEQLARTAEFYLARTSHGSTLSRVVHASALAAVDPERAWGTFRDVLDADLDDTQHGTTRAGIHLGAMAGSIDLLQRSFAGLRMGEGVLSFNPRFPSGLRALGFQLRYRGHALQVDFDSGRLRIESAPGRAAPVQVRVGGREVPLAAGERLEFSLRHLDETPAAAG